MTEKWVAVSCGYCGEADCRMDEAGQQKPAVRAALEVSVFGSFDTKEACESWIAENPTPYFHRIPKVVLEAR